jgi:16S rRNA (guanine527-N7)-methyltransferase
MDQPTTWREPNGPDEEKGAGLPAACLEEVAGLVETMRQMGEDTRPDADRRLIALAEAIYRWNSVVNLVSRKDIARLVTYHFCDSASLLPLLKLRAPARALDVGGSNGLPGLVLAAISPHIEVTICDSRQKRRRFLEEVCRAAPGETTSPQTFEIARVDSEAFRTRYIQSFDLILARAVTRLRLLLKWCMPLLKPGGKLAAYKGSRSSEEVAGAQAYFFSHGGALLGVADSPLANQCNSLRLFVIATQGPACKVQPSESPEDPAHPIRRLP